VEQCGRGGRLKSHLAAFLFGRRNSLVPKEPMDQFESILFFEYICLVDFCWEKVVGKTENAVTLALVKNP
jgi:hypothetical protein